MKIEAHELSMCSLFQSKENIFEISVYQRPYSWGTDQIKEFWDDLNKNSTGL